MRSLSQLLETHRFIAHKLGWKGRLGLGVLLLLVAGALAACTREQELYRYLDAQRAKLDLPASADDKTIEFIVEPGTLARAIAEQLAFTGLISDADLFEAYVRSMGIDQDLKAGTFYLRANMTPIEIVEILQSDLAAGISVTIPEGWRLEQVADFLDAEGHVSGHDYLLIARGPVGPVFTALEETIQSWTDTSQQDGSKECCPKVFERWPFLALLPSGASLEGYLFPATYQLPPEGPQASELIVRQLDAFADRMALLFDEAVAAGTIRLTLHDALVLASIVEREAAVALERPAIAGVLQNRLDAGMLLEVDATVQYAMGYQEESGQWWKTPVFLEEYQGVDSPYNTYKNAGLPPGPIAGPGVDAFRAALYPERHGFYYYVATPDGSGAHAFAETFAEHAENVRRYRGQ